MLRCLNRCPFNPQGKDKKRMKNIGGSILPSSSPEILKPMPYKMGSLQVQADEGKDTHHLCYIVGDGSKVLASHPNGYSCYNLGRRMIRETPNMSRAQADYIVRCGGTVSPALESLLNEDEAI